MSAFPSDVNEFRPNFLGQRDEPWIEALVEEYRRFEGRSVREWHQRLREPLPYYCPQSKLKFVVKALNEHFRQEPRYPKPKLQELRQQLFFCSESFSWPSGNKEITTAIEARRKQIMEYVGNPLLQNALVNGEDIEPILFADLPSERLVPYVRSDLSLSDLMLTANTNLAKELIKRSQQIDILVRGKLRPLVRQALLRGLVCVVSSISGNSRYEAHLSLSGPLGIFRHARLYGRLLVEVLPFLANCDYYYLSAIIPKGEDFQTWIIKSGDPIKPAKTSPYDSQVERRFAKDFSKATTDFDLIREPQVIKAGERLIFPDFSIKHRTDMQKTWLLEIVGYWTRAYLQKKIENLRMANIENLIICVAKRLGNSDEWPNYSRLVFYDRWIDPLAVLRVLD